MIERVHIASMKHVDWDETDKPFRTVTLWGGRKIQTAMTTTHLSMILPLPSGGGLYPDVMVELIVP